jgi:hypothetical protein
MAIASSELEARIRAALKEGLGEKGMLTRFHRHNDTIYLEVFASLGLELTAKSVEQALNTIGSFLRREQIDLEITVRSPWQPRWQSQSAGNPSDELDFAAAPLAGASRRSIDHVMLRPNAPSETRAKIRPGAIPRSGTTVGSWKANGRTRG